MAEEAQSTDAGNGSMKMSTTQAELAEGIKTSADMDALLDAKVKPQKEEPTWNKPQEEVEDDEDVVAEADDELDDDSELEDDDLDELTDEDEDDEDEEETREITPEEIFAMEFELKVGGETKTVNGEQLVRLAQKGFHATKNLEEVKELKADIGNLRS